MAMAIEMDDMRTRLLSTPLGVTWQQATSEVERGGAFFCGELENEACTDKVAASQTFFLPDLFSSRLSALH